MKRLQETFNKAADALESITKKTRVTVCSNCDPASPTYHSGSCEHSPEPEWPHNADYWRGKEWPDPKPSCVAPTQPQPSAEVVSCSEFVLRLSQHWLTEVVCDHEKRTDQALCFCGWRSEVYYTVGNAVVSWAEHAAEKIVQHALGPIDEEKQREFRELMNEPESSPSPEELARRIAEGCAEFLVQSYPQHIQAGAKAAWTVEFKRIALASLSAGGQKGGGKERKEGE